MSRRIKTVPTDGRDYKKMLKDYFGFHLYGLEVKTEGGQVQAQVIYEDFKHIDTVRRELAQMMPEVEFTKLRRDYTDSACLWAIRQMLDRECASCEDIPVVYVKRGDDIIHTKIRDIAINELRQLEIDEDDEPCIRYEDEEIHSYGDDLLKEHSWE